MSKFRFTNQGDFIRGIREQAGVSQLELAEHLGLCKQNINNWEYGKSKIPKKRVFDICHFLCENKQAAMMLSNAMMGAIVTDFVQHLEETITESSKEWREQHKEWLEEQRRLAE